MPLFEYECGCCGRWDAMRPVAERNAPAFCSRGAEARRVFSVPVIHWPRSLWTQWSDVHDRSAKEMARDPSVERYDPTGPVAPVKTDTRYQAQRAYEEALSQHGRPEGMA